MMEQQQEAQTYTHSFLINNSAFFLVLLLSSNILAFDMKEKSPGMTTRIVGEIDKDEV